MIIAETSDRIVDCATDPVRVYEVLANSRLMYDPGAGQMTSRTAALAVLSAIDDLPYLGTGREIGPRGTFHVGTEQRRKSQAPWD